MLGERAAASLIRYAASATLGAHFTTTYPQGADLGRAMAAVSEMAHENVHIVRRSSDRQFEIEIGREGALGELRPEIANALCEGAIEGAARVALRRPGCVASTAASPNGRLLVRLEV